MLAMLLLALPSDRRTVGCDGDELLFSRRGALLQQHHYAHGVLDGVQAGWYESGRPAFYRMYRNGLEDGPAYQWYDGPGSPPFSTGAYAMGHEVGLHRMWRPDGSLRINYVAVDDVRYGLTGSKECRR